MLALSVIPLALRQIDLAESTDRGHCQVKSSVTSSDPTHKEQHSDPGEARELAEVTSFDCLPGQDTPGPLDLYAPLTL